MRRSIGLALGAILLGWGWPARAEDPYLVYVSFGRNPLAERARTYLEEQLNVFSRWMDHPSRVSGFPSFEVRPLRAGVSLRNTQTIAIINGDITGQEQNEPNARVDINVYPALSLLQNPASQFRPVRGIVRTGERGNLRTSMRMYEAIILYGLLIRAFEQRQRPVFIHVFGRLGTTIRAARSEFGTNVSFGCLTFLQRNAEAIARLWNTGSRNAVDPGQKEFVCR